MTRKQWDELFLKIDTMPLDEFEKIIVDSARKAGVLQTNGDLVRQMNDEELAEWIESIEPAACPWRDDHGDNCRFTRCRDCWLDWLKAPVDEVDNG